MRGKTTRAALALATGLIFGGGAVSASAQTTPVEQDGVSLESFRPMPGQFHNFFGIASPQVAAPWQFEITALVDYADDPLVLRRTSDGRRLEQGDIVAQQLTGHVLANIGIAGIIDLGIDLPVFLMQKGVANPVGNYPAMNEGDDPGNGGVGIGDLRIVPKIQLFNQDTPEDPGGFQVGLLIDIALPTGDNGPNAYQGSGFNAEPRLLLGYGVGDFLDIVANVGYRIQDDRRLYEVEIQDQLTVGGGLNIGVGPDRGTRHLVHIVPEINAAIPFGTSKAGDVNEDTPVEARIGAKIFPVEEVLVEVGTGMGLVPGYSTPDWRVFGAIGYSPSAENEDRDGDGILNDDDACPDDPEDFDGFQDEDGCPDPDNDGDGIPDVEDQCPLDPEDFDGDEDQDGCPESPGDRDGDGILDPDDECPDEPEDVDGFEDTDGCPDPDNDGDGIPDVDDQCPLEAEDMDGFEDEDGCPDPDNDGDRILDADDECPNEAEVYNAFEDTDGCPDEADIVMTDCSIDLGDAVIEFATASDRIRTRSYDLLNRIAQLMNTRDDIARIRVEGHTDSQGNDRYNQLLSERRAASVMEYLTEQGVDADRLESAGFGEERPVADNGTAAGRQENRRVEFNFVIPGCE